MSVVHCLPDEIAFPVDNDQTILQTSLGVGIGHTHACGRQASVRMIYIMLF